MKITKFKTLAISVLAGGMVLGGGCLNLGGWFNPQRLLQNAVGYAVNEFVLDNDAVFDLFEDGNVPTTTP